MQTLTDYKRDITPRSRPISKRRPPTCSPPGSNARTLSRPGFGFAKTTEQNYELLGGPALSLRTVCPCTGGPFAQVDDLPRPRRHARRIAQAPSPSAGSAASGGRDPARARCAVRPSIRSGSSTYERTANNHRNRMIKLPTQLPGTSKCSRASARCRLAKSPDRRRQRRGNITLLQIVGIAVPRTRAVSRSTDRTPFRWATRRCPASATNGIGSSSSSTPPAARIHGFRERLHSGVYRRRPAWRSNERRAAELLEMMNLTAQVPRL